MGRLDGADASTVVSGLPSRETVTQTVKPAAQPTSEEAPEALPAPEEAENCFEQFPETSSDFPSARQDPEITEKSALSAVRPGETDQGSFEGAAELADTHTVPQPAGVQQSGSEQFTYELLDALPSATATDQAAARSPTHRSHMPAAAQSTLRTVELLFQDEAGRRLTLHEAVYYQGKECCVRAYAAIVLGIKPGSGTGLAGMPGRWEEYYPGRSPTEYGFDATLAVLCWDHDERRAYAADEALLLATLGRDWRANLRALCERADSGEYR